MPQTNLERRKIQLGMISQPEIKQPQNFENEVFEISAMLLGLDKHLLMIKTFDKKWIMVFNDIISYKGEHLKNIDLSCRLKIIYNLLENEYIIFDLNQKEINVEEIKKRITDVDQNHDTIGNFYLVKKNHELIKIFKKDE